MRSIANSNLMYRKMRGGGDEKLKVRPYEGKSYEKRQKSIADFEVKIDVLFDEVRLWSVLIRYNVCQALGLGKAREAQ